MERFQRFNEEWISRRKVVSAPESLEFSPRELERARERLNVFDIEELPQRYLKRTLFTPQFGK